VIVNPEMVQRLFSYTFVLEVWDSMQPGKEEFIGLVKVPL
jgi:hypothetical protein